MLNTSFEKEQISQHFNKLSKTELNKFTASFLGKMKTYFACVRRNWDW